MSLSTPTPKPINKPVMGEVEFICLVATMTSLIALSLDGILPALSHVGEDLNVSPVNKTHLIISVFFAGTAVGQLFFGPFADVKGRRAAVFLGVGVFVLGSVVCMVSENLSTMLVGRLIQAFGVSGPRIASQAIVRDQFSGDAMARIMSFAMMIFIMVPMIAPLLGQIILFWFSWRHIFALFIFVGLLVGVWYWLRQPETLALELRKPFRWREFFSTIMSLLMQRQLLAYTLASGCFFAPFRAYISASQTIFVGFYGVGVWFPLVFAALALGIGLASFFNGKIVMRVGARKMLNIAMVGTLVIDVIIVSLVVTYEGLPPFVALVLVLFAKMFFSGVVFSNSTSLALEPAGYAVGLGAALIGFLHGLISVPVAMFLGSFVVDTITPLALGFLVFNSLTAVGVYLAEPSAKK